MQYVFKNNMLLVEENPKDLLINGISDMNSMYRGKVTKKSDSVSMVSLGDLVLYKASDQKRLPRVNLSDKQYAVIEASDIICVIIP